MQFTAPETNRVEKYIQDLKEDEEKQIRNIIEHVSIRDSLGARSRLEIADVLRGKVIGAKDILRIVKRDITDEEKVETLLSKFLQLTAVNYPSHFDPLASGRLAAYYDLFLNEGKREFSLVSLTNTDKPCKL